MKNRIAVVLVVGSMAACSALSAQQAGVAVNTIEAGVAVSNDVCQLIEGLDDSGIVRTVCATAEEVAQIIEFILLLRQANDAGAPAACVPLSTSATMLCATKAEIAKAVLFVARSRSARLTLDAGVAQ